MLRSSQASEQRAAGAARDAARLQAIQSTGEQARARIAAQSEAQLAAIQARGAIQNIAQQNAAMAKIVAIQAKGGQERARIAAQSAAQMAAIEAKSAADQERAASLHSSRMAQIAAKQAASAARAQPKPKANKGDSGPDVAGIISQVTGGGGSVGSEITGIAEKLGMAANAAGVVGAVIGTEIRAIAFVGEKVYEAYQYAVSVIQKLGSVGLSLAVNATSARESIVGTFEALGRSEERADYIYQRIVAQSIKTGRDQSIIAAEFKRLSSSGFKDAELDPITKMLADIADVKGASKANQIEKILEKVNAKGTLDTRVITALTNQGFSQREIYAQIAKLVNKPVADIPALIKAGKIDGDKAIDAIINVVEKKIGGAAAKQANTILSMIARIKTAAEEMFALDESSVQPIKTFLNNILEMLQSGYGDRLKAALNNLFAAIFGTALDDLNSKTGKDQLVHMFLAITDGVNQAASAVRQLRPEVQALLAMLRQAMSDGTIKGLIEVGKAAGEQKLISLKGDLMQKQQAAKTFDSPLDTAKDIVTNPFKSIAVAIGQGGQYEKGEAGVRSILGTRGPSNDNASAGISAGDAASSMIPRLSNDDTISDVTGQGLDIGSALNLGMVQGIEDNADASIAAGGAMAQRLIDHVRAILQVNSPSEVFSDIGGYTALGFAQGVDNNAHHAANAAASMASGAAGAASGFGSAFGPSSSATGGKGSTSGGAGMSLSIGQLIIGPGASAKAGGDEALSKMVVNEIEAWMRRQGEAA